MYLHGRVVTEGGKPPPERVVAVMDCGLQPRFYPYDPQQSGSYRQAVTDSKGRFSLYPATNPVARVVDASLRADSPFAGYRALGREAELLPSDLSNCVMYVELPGYRSDERLLSDSCGMGGLDVGALVRCPLDGFLSHGFSPTTLQATIRAFAAFRKGVGTLLGRNPKYTQAIRRLEEAVATYP